MKNDDSVCVGAFAIVIDAPTISCLGEFLIVYYNQHRLQTGLEAARHDCFLQLYLASANLSDFKSHMAARPKHAMKLSENFSHRQLPLIELFRDGQLDGCRIDSNKPASQPVVPSIIDYVQEWRRSDDQGDAAGRDLGNTPRVLGPEPGVAANRGESLPGSRVTFRKELAAFAADDFRHMPARRFLAPGFVYFPLRLY